MLTARKVGFWQVNYDISADGRPVTRLERSAWRSRGSYELDGVRYQLRSNWSGRHYDLVDAADRVVACSDGLGGRTGTVSADGVSYPFRRASIWRSDQLLLAGDQPVGRVRRSSSWSGTAEADLPGVPLPVQVFILTVLLTRWDNAAAASAGAGAAT
jgi:hypothetical protein